MFNTLDIRHQLLFFQPTKGAPASISPTTAADPSHSFRMTINVSLIMTSFPPIVILNEGKNALQEKREMGW